MPFQSTQNLAHHSFITTSKSKIGYIFYSIRRASGRLFNKPVDCIKLSSSAKSLVQLGNTFTQSGCGCLKKCLQLSKLLPLPSHKLHTFPKIHKKKKKKRRVLLLPFRKFVVIKKQTMQLLAHQAVRVLDALSLAQVGDFEVLSSAWWERDGYSVTLQHI